MLGKALILGILAGILNIEGRVGQFGFTNPLVSSTIVGLVLGNMTLGITVGITLQLMWMGVVGIGAAVTLDVIIGAVLASSFAILTGQGPEVALAVAVPVSVAGQALSVFAGTITAGLTHWAEARVQKGKPEAVVAANLAGMVVWFFRSGLPVFLAILFGVDAVKTFLTQIPPVITTGLQAAGGMMPAIGFGMLLSMVGTGALFPYFFVGFALSTFLKVPLVGVTVFGAAAAFLHDYMTHRDEPFLVGTGEVRRQGALTRSDLLRTVGRTFFLQAAWNFERMQNLGWAHIVYPVLKKFYKNDPEKLQAAVQRNLEFFNTQPYMASPILGVAIAMEEDLANGGDVTPEAISAFKVATMGPLAGVGDSLFWMTIRPICLGIGVSLAAGGNILGPIVFLLLFSIPHLWTRYYPLVKGYEMGISFLGSIQGSLQRFTEALGVLGMMVLGTMTATMVSLSTKAVIPIGQAKVTIQTVLDSIFPNMLPLVVTYICYRLFKKGVSPTKMVLASLAIGLAGALIRFFK